MKIIKRKFCLVYDQMSAAAAHLLRTFIPIYFWTRSSCTPLANEHSEYFSLSTRTKIEDLLWLVKFGKTSNLLPFYRIRMLNTRPLSHADTLLATSIYREEAKKYIDRSTKENLCISWNSIYKIDTYHMLNCVHVLMHICTPSAYQAIRWYLLLPQVKQLHVSISIM